MDRILQGALRLLVAGVCAAVVPAISAQEVLEEIVEQTYPVDKAAKFTLQNADGSVRIYGADTAEMQVQAIKKAYTKDRLSKINVNVVVQPGSIAIKTGYPPKPKWGLTDRSGTVDYIIVLPWSCEVQLVEVGNGELLIDGMRGDAVHAQLGNGRALGHNCFTDLHLDVGNGALDVAYDWWENHHISVSAKIAGGNSWVFIPGDAEFRLHAETVGGHVFNYFPTNGERPSLGRTKLDLEAGPNPNAQMTIHAVNGSINIRESYPDSD